MELLIVGTLDGQIGAASKIAIAQGGHVSLADKIENALDILRSGKNIELVTADYFSPTKNTTAEKVEETKNEGLGGRRDLRGGAAAVRGDIFCRRRRRLRRRVLQQ